MALCVDRVGISTLQSVFVLSQWKQASRYELSEGSGSGFSRSWFGAEKSVLDDRFDSGPSSSTGGHGPQKGGDKAPGRSRGGLTPKVHLLADELSLPAGFLITGAQISDYTPAVELLCQRNARR